MELVKLLLCLIGYVICGGVFALTSEMIKFNKTGQWMHWFAFAVFVLAWPIVCLMVLTFIWKQQK